MKRQFIGLACAISMAVCYAQQRPSTERTLPGVVVHGPQEQPIDLSTLHTGGKSVLIVLDASMPSAQEFLSALNSKEQDLDERVKILVLGEIGSIERLQPAMKKIHGGTWLRADQSRAIRDLQLPGIPCMLGLLGAHKIAWQFSGVPNPPERAFFMVRDWLQTSDTPPQGQ